MPAGAGITQSPFLWPLDGPVPLRMMAIITPD
jgi:hypothetical protein